MKLKTYEKAEKAIAEALKESNNDLNSLVNQAKFITLLATVHERSGNSSAANKSLNEVNDF